MAGQKQDSQEPLHAEAVRIEVHHDELFGKCITIFRASGTERDSIVIKVVDGSNYTLGELVITDKMKVFYNHRRRFIAENKGEKP